MQLCAAGFEAKPSAHVCSATCEPEIFSNSSVLEGGCLATSQKFGADVTGLDGKMNHTCIPSR